MRKYTSIATLVLLMSAPSFGSIRIHTPSQIKKILGPYPTAESQLGQRDFDILYDFQNTRTPEECELAAAQDVATLTNLFAGKGGPLTKTEARKMTIYLAKAYAETSINIKIAKTTFKRPRPYITDARLSPCVPRESSYAYPSGHTTLARVFANLLSKIYPKRKDAFMKRADEVAHHRVMGGVHHPSDIEAGKKFADILTK